MAAGNRSQIVCGYVRGVCDALVLVSMLDELQKPRKITPNPRLIVNPLLSPSVSWRSGLVTKDGFGDFPRFSGSVTPGMSCRHGEPMTNSSWVRYRWVRRAAARFGAL